MKKTNMIIFLMALVLVFNATALQIDNPEHKIYTNTTVNLLINHNAELDNIIYQLDSGQPVLACTNCSQFSNNLVVTEGVHIIETWGQKNGTSYTDSVTFTVDLPDETNDFSVIIQSPIVGADYSNNVLLSVYSNKTLEKIRYKIDSDSYETICVNCSSKNKTLELSPGEHTIIVKGYLNDEIKTTSATFTVSKNSTYSLNIIKPTSKTYNGGTIPFEVKSNVTLDKITVTVGDYEKYCTDCSRLTGEVNLSNGSYSFKAVGDLDGVIKERTVWFKISNSSNDDDNDEDEDEDNGAGHNDERFGTGFEKLPQMLENGEITDSELAKIFKNNLLNPGILNRLIKSGKLGDQSIDALLKYQTFMPTGIWMKFTGFFGFHHSYSDDIYKYYGKNKNITKKLASSDDLPKGVAKKIQKDLSEDMDKKINRVKDSDDEEDSNEKDSKKQLTIGKEKPFNDSKLNWSWKGKDKGKKEDNRGNWKFEEDD